MNDTIIAPVKDVLIIGSKTYEIGKLTIIQIYKLLKILNDTFYSKKELTKDYAEKTKESKSNEQDLLTLLNFIGEDHIIELLSIVLREDDKKYLEYNIGLEETTEIIKLLIKHNNFMIVKKNFNEIMQLLSQKK